jgi:peptide/nickel transport system permease protein
LFVVLASSGLSLSNAEPARLNLVDNFAAPSLARPLGAGEGGIELGAFVGHACLRALLLAASVSLCAAAIGVCLGTIAAERRGKLERFVLAICDLVQAFPSFLLALAVLAAVERPERWHLGIVFSLLAWAPFARLTHAMAKTVLHAEFVVAARALGASRRHIAIVHVIPHLLGPLAVQMGACAAGIVLSESSLGFIGLGPSDGISLGSLLEQGTVAMLREPRVLIVGALAIAATSGALQLASEGLRAHYAGFGRLAGE